MAEGPLGGPRPFAESKQVMRVDVEPRVQGEDMREGFESGRQVWLENEVGIIERAELPPEAMSGERFNTINVFLPEGVNFSLNRITSIVDAVNEHAEADYDIIRSTTTRIECI